MFDELVVWDREGNCSHDNCHVVYWNSYMENEYVTSLPRYIENNAQRLRDKYLAFIYEIGRTEYKDKTLIQHLTFSSGFSYWWMTLIAEKSPYKSANILNCVKAMAFEEILNKQDVKSLVLVSNNQDTKTVLQRLAQDRGLIYRAENIRNKSRHKINFRKLYYKLPMLLQGLISLRHQIKRLKLRRSRPESWFSSENSIFMCSYFFNLDTDRCEEGKFYSRQWETLPDHFGACSKELNWAHHYTPSPGTPDISTCNQWLYKFNTNSNSEGKHAFVESYLSFFILLKTIGQWIYLNTIYFRLRDVGNNFTEGTTGLWLWPYYKNEWKKSLLGPDAMQNCLWLFLFDAFLSSMPKQKLGLYLWENQAWEQALLCAWRKNNHGKIIGIPHSTIRFWTLGNFDDRRLYGLDKNKAKHFPDCLAINGPLAYSEMKVSGYPENQLIKVEAMRYNYISSMKIDKINKKNDEYPGVLRVLIIGDFNKQQTKNMLHCFEQGLNQINQKVYIVLKPHPACHIRKEDYMKLDFNITDKPLQTIAHEFDVAFSSNTTSACVDAILLKLPVVIFLDPNDFNQNPLRSIESIHFVSTGVELASALNTFDEQSHIKIDDIFWTSQEYMKWTDLISTDSNNNTINKSCREY